MPQHLHPAFVASFTDGTEQQKTSMIEQLVADWLRAGGNPIPINHTMCLVELLQSTGGSAARRCLVEQLTCRRLITALLHPPSQAVAAKCTSALLLAYEPSSTILCDELINLLDATHRPPALREGLARLAETSARARRDVFPLLLAASQQALTTTVGSPGTRSFDAVARGFADVACLRGCLEQSPYQTALDRAFPRAARGAAAAAEASSNETFKR